MSGITEGHGGPQPDLFAEAERTRLAQLALGQPDSGPPAYIEAVVSLIWPYSSKASEFSLLLAEPDVRLRNAKGQLKVTFHGHGARAVARSQVGIGDTIKLHLAHAEWTNTGDAVSTPGKKADWDLHFKNRVALEVRSNGRDLATVNYQRGNTPPPTPAPSPVTDDKLSPVNGLPNDSMIAFATPLATSKRIFSGSFIDASLDPFADDDGFVVGKGRKRTKFGRTSGAWRLVDEGEENELQEEQRASAREEVSPVTQVGLPDQPNLIDEDAPEAIVLDDSTSPEISPVEAAMPPPTTPFRRAPGRIRQEAPESEATTPRLHPLLSPGLPLVSPLIKNFGASVGYFGVQPSAVSELDAISISPESPQRLDIPSGHAGSETTGNGAAESSKQPLDSSMQSTEIRPDLASGDTDELPSPTFNGPSEAQIADCSNSVTGPSFGVASSPFAGFGSQPTAFSSTAFSTNTEQSPFTARPSSSGSQFAAFGNSIGLGSTSGLGTQVGFGFGSLLSPDDEPHANETRNFPELEKLDSEIVGEEPIERLIVRQDLQTFRQSRSESQLAEDDDMYGPARPAQRSPSVTSVASGKSGRPRHERWQDSLNVTAVDVETGKLPSPTFPFVQKWHQNESRSRRSSQRASPLDGTSDEKSEDEKSQHGSDVAGTAERVTLDTSSEVVEVSTVAPAESHAEASITLTASKSAQVQVEEMSSVQVVDDKKDIKSPAASQPEQGSPEVPFPRDHTIREEHTEESEAHQELHRALAAVQEQLVTPDNTQQDAMQISSMEIVQQIPSLQMPPTPDNTQERDFSNMFHLDGMNDFHPIEQNAVEEPMSTVADVTQKGELWPSRPTLDLQGVSRPYFTPSNPPRRSPEAQREIVQEGSKEHAVHEPEELASLSPPNVKIHRSMLGMVSSTSYYTPLPNLSEHFNQQVDILAICSDDTDQPIRSKKGPKDYYIALQLVDLHLDGAAAISAQLFRPNKSALPVVRRGQVILLRTFKVQSLNHEMTLLSTASSSWAVFTSPDAPAKKVTSYELHVKTPGPPVEYGSEEHVYAKKLMEWWDEIGAAIYPSKGDNTAETSLEETRSKKDAAGDLATDLTDETSNERSEADKLSPKSVHLSRMTRSSRRINNHTDNTENHDEMSKMSAPPSPVLETTHSEIERPPKRNTGRVDGDTTTDELSQPTHAHPTSPVRTTRSSRRTANRTDNPFNNEEPDSADTIEALPEMPSPKVGRRPRRSTSILSATLEPVRSLRSQSSVHELRDGTKYVDGHVPSKKDGVHELRDGTKYIDENTSPAGHVPNEREESVVHELRDGTNYVDRMPSKSPDVRKSARHKRGGSLVHELRDGARYTDE